MPPKRKSVRRKFLSLSAKLEVIAYFNRTKCSFRKLAQQFCIGKTQAGEIIKKQKKYLALWNAEIKTENLRPDSIGFLIDKCVYEWYEEKKEENCPVTGPMLQNKALEIARELGNEEFKASNGWLERFRVRHKIRLGTSRRALTRKNDTVFTVDDWKKQLDLIYDEYSRENIFSAVETGLFFGAVPEETRHLITETCSSGKLADHRFTIVFCISMDGKKEKPLVIRQPPKNRSNKNCDLSKYQVDCEYSALAWLSRNIITKWLKDFDKRMRDQNRNVVLFLNDTFFNCEPHLENMKIVYFPSCLFPENQTFNQGVIQNFKIIYRQLLLKRLIELKESDEKIVNISQTIYSNAIGWVETAWKEISESVIHRCFEEIGFSSPIPNTVTDNEAFLNDVSNLLYAYDSDVNAVDYVSIDADLITSDIVCNEPELIEVLVDGDEMRNILIEEDEVNNESKNPAPDKLTSNLEEMECNIDVVSPPAQCSEQKSNSISSIDSYSDALLSLRNLEHFYQSQNDSKAALLVRKLITHNENAMDEE